jgi:hypothetical protein
MRVQGDNSSCPRHAATQLFCPACVRGSRCHLHVVRRAIGFGVVLAVQDSRPSKGFAPGMWRAPRARRACDPEKTEGVRVGGSP